MYTIDWNALGWAFLIYLALTVVLPVLLSLGWLAYLKLTPAGRAWHSWYDSELTRLKTPEPRQGAMQRKRVPLRREGVRVGRLRTPSGRPSHPA